MPTSFRIAEFFCGIGGCAAAVGGRAEIATAVDINRQALAVYSHNFPQHPACVREIESLPGSWFDDRLADLWWLSPPCQPYTVKGNRRDVNDPRARSLLFLIGRLAADRPRYVALENVPLFCGSEAHGRLRSVLDNCGYTVREHSLCPTQFGWPMLRKRFYLVAARDGHLSDLNVPNRQPRRLLDFLDENPDPALELPLDLVLRMKSALDIVNPAQPAARAACFAASYGRALTRSGSYLATASGARRFSPEEIQRLLGFPESFRMPPSVLRRSAWALLGNSLSVPVVASVLATICELRENDFLSEHSTRDAAQF